MDNRIDKIINIFIQRLLKKNVKVEKAFLFGSYAKKEFTKNSDIDIALVVNNLGGMDRFDLQVYLLLISNEIDSRIEPHPISKEDFNNNNPFAFEIMQTGLELKITHPCNI